MDDTTGTLRAVDLPRPCSACNGKGYFRIGTEEAICRKCHPRTEEEQRPFPSITPSLFFTEDEVKSVNWEAVFNEW
jgi:hypothetical protein